MLEKQREAERQLEEAKSRMATMETEEREKVGGRSWSLRVQ